jgi:hypothetical protein
VKYATLVSSVPRPGTSLTMRMLERGGIPIVSDGLRIADEHNAHGYFEDQRGKAVQVIYRLLPHLPAHLDYRVLFMQRNLLEVYDS